MLRQPLLGGYAGGFPKPIPLPILTRTSSQPIHPRQPPGGARASHSHFPCSLFSAEEVAPLCGQTGPSTYLWGLRRRPAHMQARRQRRPRQTPTMMPVTECTSKESGRGEGGNRTDQGQEKTRGS